MNNLKLAVLDEQLDAELASVDATTLRGIDVVWRGTDLTQFRANVPRVEPDAIAVNLATLGENPALLTRELAEETGAQMVFVLYTFARREVLDELQDQRLRPLRAPLSVESLRGFLSSMLVRKILSGGGGLPPLPPRPPVARRKPEASRSTLKSAPATDIPPMRYSDAQLGRLRRIQTSIECECPAHMADLLTMLVAFEQYSANCSNRNEQDRQVHALLHRETAKARALLESALGHLLEHENIAL